MTELMMNGLTAAETDATASVMGLVGCDLPPLPPALADFSFDDHDERWYTADQMREYARAAVLAERERNLQAVASMATESKSREERDVIASCWNAIKRAAAIREGE